MALDYGEVKDLYNSLLNAGQTRETLVDWSKRMNDETGSDLFNAGVHDNWIKRSSYGLDQLLEKSGASNMGAAFGGAVTAPFGLQDKGEEIGRGLPRMAVNFAPLLIPGAGVGVAAGRLGLMGLLSGAETYTKTDSPAAGLISGLTNAALPKTADLAEQAVLKGLGGRLVEGPLADATGNVVDRVSRYFPNTIGQRAASIATGQGVAAGVMGGSDELQQYLQTGEVNNPFNVDMLLNLTLGQAPFAALHLAHLGQGKPADLLQHAVDVSKQTIELKAAREEVLKKTPAEQVPILEQNPEDLFKKSAIFAEINTRLSQVRGETLKVKDDPNLTPEAKVEKINLLMNQEAELNRGKEYVAGTTVFGNSIDDKTDRTPVIGRQIRSTDKWRAIFVADHPDNPEELRGKIVGYSTAFEPNPTPHESGATNYSLPAEQWRTVKTADEWRGLGRKYDPNQPELPQQPREPTREEMFGHITELAKVEVDAENAQTPADLHRIVTNINDVKEQMGLPPTNDASLRRTAKTIEKSGIVSLADAAKAAVKVEAKKAARRIEKVLSPEEAAHVSAIMGGGEAVQPGFHIVTEKALSKGTDGDPEVAPVSDVVTDAAFAVMSGGEGKAAFDTWGDRGEHVFAKDVQDFMDLVERFGLPRAADAKTAAEFLNERFGTSGWDANEVKDFLNRPHVKIWSDRLETALNNIAAKTSVQIPVNRIPAGNNFYFALRPLEQVKGLSKEGTMSTSRFRNVANERGSMSNDELEFYRTLVPEAFDGDKVNVRRLYSGLQERGPQVEVRKLGTGLTNSSSIQEQARSYQHALETAGYSLEDDGYFLVLNDNRGNSVQDTRTLPEHLRTAYDFLRDHNDELRDDWEQIQGGDGGGGRYAFIAPKPESEMPGYVEGLVRAPLTKEQAEPLQDKKFYPKDEGQKKQVQYTGPHFGTEDKNVLAFYRGYEETLPDGSKAFHVIEVQSDWGQLVSREVKQRERIGEAEPQKTILVPQHPLLRVYESLALKAAIQHAKEIGATKVILSDAETAMMTEGHDRHMTTQLGVNEVVDRINNGTDQVKASIKSIEGHDVLLLESENGAMEQRLGHNNYIDLGVLDGMMPEAVMRKLFPEQHDPPQAGGMRLHYDQTLPSAMEKLTGERGTDVSLGFHKSAASGGSSSDPVIEHGSPVFRDASGKPKTQITGRVYDISKLSGGFTLTDPTRSSADLQRPAAIGQEEPYIPQSEEDKTTMQKWGLNEGAAGVLKYLQNQTDIPELAAWAKDLKGISEATLKRISVGVYNMSVAGYTTGNWNGEAFVKVSHGLLNASPEMQTLVLAHEMGHALTRAEIHNPEKSAIVNQLDALRVEMVNKLPSRLREEYDNATASNWYKRYVDGEVSMESLSPKFEDGEILYGLLNTDEFVTQGWNSKPFREFLQAQRVQGKVSGFGKFVNYVKSLLGIGEKVKDSAFQNFVDLSSRLVQRGNYISDFRNFGEGFYRNLGFSDALGSDYTKRALGVLIDSSTMHLGTGALFDTLALPTPIRSQEYIKGSRAFDQMVFDKAEDYQDHVQVMSELGINPDRYGMDTLAMDMLHGEVELSVLDMMPQPTLDFLFAKVKDYRNVLAVLKAGLSEKNQGLLNINDPAAVRPTVAEAQKLVNRVLSVEAAHEFGRQTVDGLRSIEPDVFLDRMMDPTVSKMPEWVGEGKTKEDRIGWLKKAFGTAAQLSRSDPITAEFFDKGFEIMKNVRNMHDNIMRVMGIDLDSNGTTLTKKGLDEATKVVKNPRTLSALNKWMWLDQKIANDENKGVTMLPTSHPEVAKLLNGLTEDERHAVINARAKTVLMTKKGQAEEMAKRAEYGITLAAKIVLKDRLGVKPGQAIDLARNVWDATGVNFQDPQQAQEANAKLQVVQQRLSPEGFLALLKATQAARANWTAWQQFYDANPAYATARRMERYLIEYRRGKKLVLDQGSSKKEVLEKAKGATITKAPWDQYANDEDQYLPPTMSEETFNRLQELENNQLDAMRPYMDAEEVDRFQRMSVVQQFAREQAANADIGGFRAPSRLLSKGADELPWLWNHISWAERLASHWSRQLFRAQSDLMVANPEFAERKDIRDMIRTHTANVLSPDPRAIQEVNKFVTTWYLSSLASPIINGFQTLTTMMPELTRMNGGKILDSYKRWGQSVKAVSEHALERKPWESKEMEKFMKSAIADGEVDYSMWDENAATQQSIATRWKQLMRKQKVQTVGERASNVLDASARAGLWLFKQPEKFNRFAALHSAFKLARENGMDFDAAKTEAYRFNRAVNFGGGKANRPIGVYSGQGTFPRALAMLGTNLQGYNIGVISQLARFLQDGFFRPEGLKPAEVWAARKAATQVLGTQLALGGLLGLPFVSGMLALLNSAFPNLEVNRHVREHISQLFGADTEEGSTMSDIAMTGLPSMLGWDMQSRLSMGNLVPGVNEYNGFQPELLLGPPVSLGYSYLNGLGKLVQGQPQGAEAFVPPGIKKLFDLIQTGGKAVDYAGRPTIDLTPGEQIGAGLGFQPKRVSDYNVASRLAKQTDDANRTREGQFHQNLAEEVTKGNFGTVRQALLSRAQEDKNYDPVAGVKSVAKTAEALTFPRDLRREGTLATSPARRQLLNALGVSSPLATSEIDRLKFRQGVEARLGLGIQQDRTQEVVAGLMDELRHQHPELSRAELRNAAERLVQRRKLGTLLEPTE